jgi:hypothetical protein
LRVAHVEKAHIHFLFGELVAQHVLNLVELKLGIANKGNVLVFQLDAGGGAFEVKARGDFLGRVFHAVFDFGHFCFADGIK